MAMRRRVCGIPLFQSCIRVVALLSVLAAVGDRHAMAAGPWFDIPEGFESFAEDDISAEDEWQGLVVIRPVEGAFSDLSSIRLRAVTGTVKDPDEWLNSRLSADVGDGAESFDLFESPDSPFGDPAFDVLREALPRLFSGIEALSQLPLEFCEGPNTAYNASGELRELYCVFQLGPFRQYLVLRLQNNEGLWYYTEIRAMNERRFRHLLAIANSFQASR